ncbi:ring-cleaving dioxygenase [Salipaludibacillus agaradhaerens]|uniref:Ring-cleaving dioxygenase n=1 Tax=Salipaludibacillus agaradhaerens TaxID=76935 RepID=A0A9Q4B0Z6_SALAG|nr:ring-cleaving dioxygenase [Salipaludibacillus agaradhaerens]MCR6096329.1 ring-cleaving dioxygenase [Salipaludibacillus agaradhaerens]MCR6114112.1 ring-cleaving dioxygenase [Salipaludibacillus agaradhaerens]
MKPLKGIHHISAITANAKENLRFYTEIIGMRLVKKTVNQDDTSMYHLFYADKRGNPGTDLTFFEIPNAGRTYPGTQSISETSLRVANDEALNYWLKRLAKYGVSHDNVQEVFNRKVLKFRDFEGQRLQFVSDETNEGVAGGEPWPDSPVPVHQGVIGLGPVELTVPRPEKTHRILTEVMGFREVGTYENDVDKKITVFATGEGGTGAEVHVKASHNAPRERPGRGSVHHVAFRVESEEELHKWVDYISSLGMTNSGFVERYYFKSLYFRESNGILFELATDGPGFETDETLENLGQSLALPPYLENKREEIESTIKPL